MAGVGRYGPFLYEARWHEAGVDGGGPWRARAVSERRAPVWWGGGGLVFSYGITACSRASAAGERVVGRGPGRAGARSGGSPG